METTNAPAAETITVQGQGPAGKSHLWAGDHFSFHDLLDTINPLQHIPIVGTIYRAVTGDTLGNAARVVGDGLYGGVIGVIAGLVDVNVLENTGKDIGGNIMSALGLGDDKTEAAGDDAAPEAVAAPAGADIPVPSRKPAPPPAATPVAAPAPAPAPAPTGIPLASIQPQRMPLSTGPKMMALNSQARSFPIDTSAEGILALKTTANSAPRPVPLNIPAGTLAPNQQIPQRIPVTGAEFAQRMSEGLDKYKALMAEREATSAGATVNQVQ
jgi:hypothetical protein